MTHGKQTCKILKNIRQQIAKENDITLVTSECKYKGECLGTCPKCEAEVRYLETELAKRQKAGKRISIVGMAASVAAALTLNSCVTAGEPPALTGDPVIPSDTTELQTDTTQAKLNAFVLPEEPCK